MILTGSEIKVSVTEGSITLQPFSHTQINPNSYNYRLGSRIKVFSEFKDGKSRFVEQDIPEKGFILEPGQMYLTKTLEKIGSTTYAMSLIGRSSLGRLGLFLQVSANLGHVGSTHCWTLELVAAKPIRVYQGMIIGQVSFWTNYGEIESYEGLYGNLSEIVESRTSIV